MSRESKRIEDEPVMGRDPLSEDDEILAETFFGTPARARGPAPARPEGVDGSERAPAPRSRRAPRRKRKPGHYRIVSISLYNEDIEQIDELVRQLKEMGHTKANRSALIRYAIDTVDIKGMPRSY